MLKVPAQGQCQSAPASAHAPQKSMYPPPHINASPMMRPAIFAGIFLLGLYPRHELLKQPQVLIRQRAGVEYPGRRRRS